MPKEVIDILPPQKFEESKIVIKKTPIKEVKKKMGKKKFFIFLFLILIIGEIIYGQKFSKVKIEIWPKMEKIESKIEITINEKTKQLDLVAKIIPGYLLEEQNSFTQSFSSSGKVVKDKKAEGTIRVFNDFSALSLPLREDTRFMAASGHIFRIPIKIIVPGNKTEKGKTIPGSIDVKVIAEEPGPDYNIEPTTFSIPGLAGTPSYTKFYGKSFEPMQGGFKGEISQTTKEDLEKAELSVIQKLKEEGQKILEKKAADSDSIFLKDVFQQEVKATSSSAIVGTETEKFDFSATTKLTVLLFKKEDVMKLIANQLIEKKEIYEKTLKTDWTAKEINLKDGKAIFDLDIKGDIYSNIAKSDLKKELREKTLLNAQIFLEKKAEISKVKITSWPFWIKKIPRNPDKIETIIKLD